MSNRMTTLSTSKRNGILYDLTSRGGLTQFPPLLHCSTKQRYGFPAGHVTLLCMPHTGRFASREIEDCFPEARMRRNQGHERMNVPCSDDAQGRP